MYETIGGEFMSRKFKTLSNLQMVQNYKPSTMKRTLQGLSLATWLDYPTTYKGWEEFINLVIKDLELGHAFNGCGAKNTVLYWNRQKEILKELMEDTGNE